MEADIVPQSVPPDIGQAGQLTLPSQYFGKAEKEKIVKNVEDYWLVGDANINNQNITVNVEMDVSHSFSEKERSIVLPRKLLPLSNSVVIGSTNKSTVTGEASPTPVFSSETQSKVIRLLANEKENFYKIVTKRHQASSSSTAKKFAIDVPKNENRFAILNDENDQDKPVLKPNGSAAYNRNNTTKTPAGGSKNSHSSQNSSSNRTNNSSGINATSSIRNLKQNVERRMDTWCPPRMKTCGSFGPVSRYIIRIFPIIKIITSSLKNCSNI